MTPRERILATIKHKEPDESTEKDKKVKLQQSLLDF